MCIPTKYTERRYEESSREISPRGGRVSSPTRYRSIQDYLKEFEERARDDLTAPPEIAVLVPADSSQPFAGHENVCGVASVEYLSEKHWLVILRIPRRSALAPDPARPALAGMGLYSGEVPSTILETPEVASRHIQLKSDYARQILKLAEWLCEQIGEEPDKRRLEDALIWPLHVPELSRAILFQQARIRRHHHMYDNRKNLARLLLIAPLRHDGRFISALQDHFGRDVGLIFFISSFYARSLWVLALFCSVLIVVGVVTPDSLSRTRLHIAQAVVVLWAIAVASFGSTQFATIDASLSCAPPELPATWPKDARRSRTLFAINGPRAGKPRWQRTCEFVFVAMPLVFLLLFGTFIVFASVTNLILNVIYRWGGCLDAVRNETDTECRDAQAKRGPIMGLVAEVACDILLVVVFEVFLPLCEVLGEYIADLRNYDHEVDRRLLARTLASFLACLEAMGFRCCLAFVFVPQWNDPDAPLLEANTLVCEQLRFGLWCELQRDLNIRQRRYVFEKLLTGPFCVAPFVRILTKVVLPRVADCVSRFFERHRERKHWGWCCPGMVLFRIFALIFSYECDHVGCWKFLVRGWPFRHLRVEEMYRHPTMKEHPPPAEVPAPQEAQGAESGGGASGEEGAAEETVKKMRHAMEQFVSKRFEPDAELLELKLGCVGVIFFGPVMPLGVLITLVAMIFEIRTDLFKMLFVCRRSVPSAFSSMSKDFMHFLVAIAFCSVGWHAGLALITYNDGLWRWGVWGEVIIVGLSVWVLVAGCVKLLLIDMHRKLGPSRTFEDGNSQAQEDAGQPPEPAVCGHKPASSDGWRDPHRSSEDGNSQAQEDAGRPPEPVVLGHETAAV